MSGPRFVSTLLKTIEAAGPKQKWTGTQLRAFLKNKGVKPAEIEHFERQLPNGFAGFDDLGPLNGTEWVNELRSKQMRVEPRVFGGRPVPQEVSEDRVRESVESVYTGLAGQLMREGAGYSPTLGRWLSVNPQGEVKLWPQEAVGSDVRDEVWKAFMGGRIASEGGLLLRMRHWSDLELPSLMEGIEGDNSGLKLAEKVKGALNEALPPSLLEEATRARLSAPRIERQPQWTQYTTPYGDRDQETVFRTPGATPLPSSARSRTHYPGDEHYLGHMRTKERSGGALMVEEWQNDLYQQTKPWDYRDFTGDYREVLKGLLEEKNELKQAIVDARNGRDWLGMENLGRKLTKLNKQIDRANEYDYALRLPEAERGVDPRIPADLPWRTNWVERMFQAALTEAAQKGLDTLEWTPGYVQAQRWDPKNLAGYQSIYDKQASQIAQKFMRQYEGGQLDPPSKPLDSVLDSADVDEDEAEEIARRQLADDEPNAEDFPLLDEDGEETGEFDDEAYTRAMSDWEDAVRGRRDEIIEETRQELGPDQSDAWSFVIPPALLEIAKKGEWPTWAVAPGAIGLGALASDDAEAAFSTRIPRTIPMGEASALMDARRDAAKALQEGDSITDVLDRTGWQPDMQIENGGSGLYTPSGRGLVLPRDIVEREIREGTTLDNAMSMLGREIPAWNGTIDWSRLGSPAMGPNDDFMDIGTNPAARSAKGGALLGEFADLPDLYRFDPEYRALTVLPDDRDGYVGSASWRTGDAWNGRVTPAGSVVGIDNTFDASPLSRQLAPLTGLFNQRGTLLTHEIPHIEREASISASDDPFMLSRLFGDDSRGYWKTPHEIGSRASELRGRDAPGGPLEPYIDTVERVRLALDQPALPGDAATNYRRAGYFLPKGITRRAGAGAGITGALAFAQDDANAAALSHSAPDPRIAEAGERVAYLGDEFRRFERNAAAGVAGAIVGAVPDTIRFAGDLMSMASAGRGGSNYDPPEYEAPWVTDEAIRAFGGNPESPVGVLASTVAPLGGVPAVAKAAPRLVNPGREAIRQAAGEGVRTGALAQMRGDPFAPRPAPYSALGEPGTLFVTSETIPGKKVGHDVVPPLRTPMADADELTRDRYNAIIRGGPMDVLYDDWSQPEILRNGRGSYRNSAGELEENPLNVYTPRIPGGALSGQDLERAEVTEQFRGILEAQEASAAHTLSPADRATANAYGVQVDLPGFARPEMVDYARNAYRMGGLDVIDRGGGALTVLPSFDGPEMSPDELRQTVELANTLFGPRNYVEPAQFKSFYEMPSWGRKNSGQATMALLDKLESTSDPDAIAGALSTDAMRERARELAQLDEELAKRGDTIPRRDIQRFRRIVQQAGLEGLRQHVKEYGAAGLPVAALVALGLQDRRQSREGALAEASY
jgi:hypothetical protein